MNNTETPPLEPQFDPKTATEMQKNASAKLQTLLKSKQEATTATSNREFAVHCVRGMEATILQLFTIGTSTQEVLTHLTDALPSIPVNDLQYALKKIRVRNKKLRVTSRIQTPTQEKAALPDKQIAHPETKPKTKPPTKASGDEPATATTNSDLAHAIPDLPTWADGSDKRADESNDDYRLRKEIEGPPEARHKFIGEHKT